jgi:hypothetical protein
LTGSPAVPNTLSLNAAAVIEAGESGASTLTTRMLFVPVVVASFRRFPFEFAFAVPLIPNNGFKCLFPLFPNDGFAFSGTIACSGTLLLGLSSI